MRGANYETIERSWDREGTAPSAFSSRSYEKEKKNWLVVAASNEVKNE